ncbi:MAG: hypothetical protein RIR50_1252, partial [Pseudomonadota bacterium]
SACSTSQVVDQASLSSFLYLCDGDVWFGRVSVHALGPHQCSTAGNHRIDNPSHTTSADACDQPRNRSGLARQICSSAWAFRGDFAGAHCAVGLGPGQGDALKFDFQAWAKEQKALLQKNAPEARVKIVGNLPYNISSPLLFHLMSAVADVDEQVFMLQAEVVERMAAQHGDSEYGRLSVMLQSKYHMENVLDVPPECFDPPPKVNSAIVKMIPRKDIHLTPKEYESLERIVSMAFAQRRKVLRNNLSSVKDVLQLSDDVLGLRAQDISVEDYISWARQLAH